MGCVLISSPAVSPRQPAVAQSGRAGARYKGCVTSAQPMALVSFKEEWMPSKGNKSDMEVFDSLPIRNYHNLFIRL